MQCPKCDAEMMPISYQSVSIDRCPMCHGIWLDKAELETVLNQQLAKVMDAGAFSSAEPPGNETPAKCHKCQTTMTVLTGAADIKFDWCDRCEGMFFDTGELTILHHFKGE